MLEYPDDWKDCFVVYKNGVKVYPEREKKDRSLKKKRESRSFPDSIKRRITDSQPGSQQRIKDLTRWYETHDCSAFDCDEASLIVALFEQSIRKTQESKNIRKAIQEFRRQQRRTREE